MLSAALQEWLTVRAQRLDEIESAHRGVGRSGPGRRFATHQINQAHAMLLCAQFQGFCRDLHTDSPKFMAQQATIPAWQPVVLENLLWNRKLDRGNPTAGNIGSDFGRLGLDFWLEVETTDDRNVHRKRIIEELTEWRNAIAHQDFDPTKLGRYNKSSIGASSQLTERLSGHGTVSFDQVMAAHIRNDCGQSSLVRSRQHGTDWKVGNKQAPTLSYRRESSIS